MRFNLDAWESYQRGLWSFYRFTAQENTEAQSFFRRAIELDPNFGSGHAGLAHAIYVSILLGFGADPISGPGEAHAAAQRAVNLDGDDALAHAIMGRVHTLAGDFDAAISACEVALALNPNLATARYGLGTALTFSGHYEEGVVEINEAIRLSPRDPLSWAFLNMKAIASFATENYVETLEIARAAIRSSNAGVWAYVHEVLALVHLDRMVEAKQALERVKDVKPDFDLKFAASTLQQFHLSNREIYIEGLRKAGLQE